MKRFLNLFLMMVCWIEFAGAKGLPAQDIPTDLKVGVSKMSITPPADFLPFHPLHEARPYTGIHDPLYARALVMDNNVRRAVLVELDEVQVPDPDNFTNDIATVAGVEPKDVILCVSHTHSTLHPNGEDPRLQPIIDHIKSQSLIAVRAAVERMEPAFISFARTKAYANINNGEVSLSKGRYDNEAYSDKTLDIVRFSKPNGTAIALVVNYATHAEVMFRSISKDNGYEISGDLPGRTAEILETQGKESPIVLTTAGAEGDQQPIFTSRQLTTTMGYIDEHEKGWALVDALAHRIVDAINESTQKMPLGTNKVVISTKVSLAVVPGEIRQKNEKTGEVTDKAGPDVIIPISQIQVNDIAFDGIGADIASSVGRDIRGDLKVPNSMLITNIGKSVGYILPDNDYKAYTHAVLLSRVKPGYARKAISNALNN